MVVPYLIFLGVGLFLVAFGISNFLLFRYFVFVRFKVYDYLGLACKNSTNRSSSKMKKPFRYIVNVMLVTLGFVILFRVPFEFSCFLSSPSSLNSEINRCDSSRLKILTDKTIEPWINSNYGDRKSVV